MKRADHMCDGIGGVVRMDLTGMPAGTPGIDDDGTLAAGVRLRRPRDPPLRRRAGPLPLDDPGDAGADQRRHRRGRLVELAVPVGALRRDPGRPVQRVPLHVLQVSVRGADGLRRELVRRRERRRQRHRARRLAGPGPLPAPAGRPVEVRRGRRRRAHLHAAQLEVQPRHRPVPHLGRPRDPRDEAGRGADDGARCASGSTSWRPRSCSRPWPASRTRRSAGCAASRARASTSAR